MVHLALALDEVEDRRDGPGRAVDLGGDGLGEDARDVVLEAAAGDVGHAGHLDVVVQQAADGLEEALVHGEKGVADRLVRARELVLRRHLADVEEHAAGEGEAVRLEAAGGQADDHVPGADGLSRDEPLAGDGADDRADEVVFVGGVEAGHFGGLAAEEGHVVLLAGLAEPLDDLLEGGAVELGGAHVVHEEEGLRALHEDVVHAVVHDVLAHRVVLLHHHGDLELGAHAVRGGDEDRVLRASLRQAAEAAERADSADYVDRFRGANHRLDGLEGVHLVVDVHAGGGVGGLCNGYRIAHGQFSPVFNFHKMRKNGENYIIIFLSLQPLD